MTLVGDSDCGCILYDTLSIIVKYQKKRDGEKDIYVYMYIYVYIYLKEPLLYVFLPIEY